MPKNGERAGARCGIVENWIERDAVQRWRRGVLGSADLNCYIFDREYDQACSKHT